MDIFKLIFEHDILLEHLSGVEDPRHTAKKEASLEDFLKPAKTYTKYYLTGTKLDEQKFGLSALETYQDICDTLSSIFADKNVYSSNGELVENLSDALQEIQIHDHLIIGTGDAPESRLVEAIRLNSDKNVRDVLPELTELMDLGFVILYAENAHHGKDFHFFSARNLYEFFFEKFQPMTKKPTFRYFSINGKKVGSERTFYFETWTLHRPPHGFEEVTIDSKLR